MEVFKSVVSWLRSAIAWRVQHKNDIDFVKDIIFAIGLIATFYGYYKFLRFLTQRNALNKKREMENDLKLYGEIHNKLKEYVDDYGASQKEPRDIGIRLLYIKNYPYKLDDDGYPQQLYYYFLSEHHKASGYISSKGLYVMEHLWFFSQSIYYNRKTKKWFVDDKGLTFKGYEELEHKQLVRRIPFANIYGYDFNSDWAEKGEPVFYTKYKYYKRKLFADDMEAVSVNQEYFLAHKVHLRQGKRAKRLRTLAKRLWRKVRLYFRGLSNGKPKQRKHR